MEAYSRRALSSKASTLITHVFASKVGPKCLEANGNVSQQHWAFTYLSTNNILPTNAHFFFLSFFLFNFFYRRLLYLLIDLSLVRI